MALQPDIQYVQFYMDGSAARKIEPKRETGKTVRPMPRRKARRRVVAVDPVALVGTVVAVIMLVAMAFGVAEYRETLLRAEQMSTYVEQLQNENAALNQVYRDSYDLEDVYEVATAIGMVPVENLEDIPISVEVPQKTETDRNVWESITTFLAGLFA